MPPPTRRRELSDSERDQVVVSLLQCSIDRVPRRGAIKEVAVKFRVDRRTISSVWKKTKAEEARSGQLRADYSGNARGRPMLDLSEKLRITPFDQRSTLRAASSACGVARATLQRRVKGGQVVAHVSNVKPFLTDENMAARLTWCILHVQPNSLLFNNMYDTIHVDEKLFYLTAVRRRYYLLPGEEAPHRLVRSKLFITNVMMLAVVARPRWNAASGSYFDSKLDIWPFIVQEPAVRSGSRRPAGTMITKEGRVNKGTYRKMPIQHLLPAVRERWPSVCDGELLRVQQDNTPAHINPMDTQFVAARDSSSPEAPTPRSIEELVEAIKAAYWELPPSTINAAFLSLQGSMNLCILDGGGNAFKPPHIGKAKLQREGRLPEIVQWSPETAAIMSQLRIA
ncbi:hypothetical protein PC129_g19417 [Phytophthora cactorum]|uniref:DUF7769 domain-containing protein n=1 Tax=Phytophthora cactorum TaxID=29920 RepID=A0A8T1F9E9_9STRA|nr:hypothetical protein PC112_g10996 [Phytophthora cactorum]KAG2832487.1 hypothetical protein PC111_g6571 [Phytophthora cactorum]KAG2856569.1 hypothetical protein PC113_g11473 [Phytophthora cactorum]KAG2888307.1 hypothetical protein PC115_g20089 [Phytophthora cactorum]KAG2899244.1 hypothetical protein PC117_g22317 [Phytophthora cactorum]